MHLKQNKYKNLTDPKVSVCIFDDSLICIKNKMKDLNIDIALVCTFLLK